MNRSPAIRLDVPQASDELPTLLKLLERQNEQLGGALRALARHRDAAIAVPSNELAELECACSERRFVSILPQHASRC